MGILLTFRQEQILDKFVEYQEENGYPPTVREMAEIVEMKSHSAVHSQMKQLQKLNLLPPVTRRYRGQEAAKIISKLLRENAELKQQISVYERR